MNDAVNGVKALEHPVIGVVSDTKTSFTCTGSLITPRWVLANAHSIRGKNNLVFTPQNTSDPQTYNIIEIRYHNDQHDHDIALIRLDRDCPISLNEEIISIQQHKDKMDWINTIVALTQIDSDGTQALPDYTETQTSSGWETNVNYHTEVHNTIIHIGPD